MSSASEIKKRRARRKRRARLSKIERAHRDKLAKAGAMQRAIGRALAKKNRPKGRPGLWAKIVRWFAK